MIPKSFNYLTFLIVGFIQTILFCNAINIFENGNQELRFKVFEEIEAFANLEGQNTTFEQWKSPEGEEYLIPLTNGSYGSGFKLIDATAIDRSKVFESLAQELQTGKIHYYLQEESVTAAGFPHFWERLFSSDDCDGDDDDDYYEGKMEANFPFGARKFLLVGVKEESLPKSDGREDEVIPIVDSKGLLFRKKKYDDDDDCDDDVNEGRKLFDTDKFFFVGIGSVNATNSTKESIKLATNIAVASTLSQLEHISTSSSSKATSSFVATTKIEKAPVLVTKTVYSTSTSTITPNSNFHPGTIITHGPHTSRHSNTRHSTTTTTATTKDYKTRDYQQLETTSQDSKSSITTSTMTRTLAATYSITTMSGGTTLKTKLITSTAATTLVPTPLFRSNGSTNIGSEFYQHIHWNMSNPYAFVNNSYINGGPTNSPVATSHWSVLSALVLVGMSVILF